MSYYQLDVERVKLMIIELRRNMNYVLNGSHNV